jgi:ribonuclease BN (tRNA processing enzyme)
MLTHVPPWYDAADALAEAKGTYTGPISLARSGDSHEIQV